MDNLEEELYNFIGQELHELAWHNEYPINSSLGLLGFFEAFEKHNFEVNFNDEKKEAKFVLKSPFENFPKFLETTLSYEQILIGWKNHPKSSPHSFYDSICIVYDNLGLLMENTTKENIEKINQWFYYRNSETRKVRQKMENVWLPFFIEHQDNMFFPVNGNAPELENPKIFYEVIKEFPMNIYKQSVIASLFSDDPESIRISPCAEHLLEIDLNKDLEIGEYYPSKSTMVEFFWGKYLDKFSEEKGYPLKYKTKNRLRHLIISGIDSFEYGHLLKWKV